MRSPVRTTGEPTAPLDRRSAVERVGGWYGPRRVVLGAFIGSRLVVGGAALVSRWVAPGSGAPSLTPPPWWAPFRALGGWDANLYRSLAEHGYSTSESGIDGFAFFPLWPLALRAVDALTPSLTLLVIGVLLAHALSLGAALRLRAFVARETGSQTTGDRAAVYLLLFPSAFAFSMVYAEALFVLVSVLYLDLLRQERWGWASGVGVLAGLTRPGGWVLALPAAIEGVRALWTLRSAALRPFAGAAAAGLGPVAGLGAYLAYAWRRTGDPFLPIELQWQEVWKIRPRFFGTSAIDKVVQVPELGFTPDAALGLAVLAGFGFAVYTFRLLPASMAAYGVAVVALGTSTQVLVGATRILLVAVPLFWGLAVLGERRGFDAGWRSVSAAAMGILAVAAFADAWIP